MEFSVKLKEVQDSLIQQNIEGWLLYDYRGSNPLAYTFLEIPSGIFLSRRFFYWIPKEGNPIKIVPQIEPYTLDHLPGDKWLYRTWQELEKYLFSIAIENAQIAMEYSPNNSIPVISKVDAGTVDMIRKSGSQVVSSANLLQKYTSVWTGDQLKSHLLAEKVLCNVVDSTWEFISEKMKQGFPLTEYLVQQFMVDEIHKHGCIMDHHPICAVNANSANPHYAPHEATSSTIKPGDFILIDLWCKRDNEKAVYADISRVGVLGSKPTEQQQKIFEIVKEARDRATLFIKEHFENDKEIQGWQVDQVCRDFITESGYGEYFIHRTGHNIGEEVHGPGANIDNYETHDFRILLPGTCFSIEPGIYIPEQFGVRLEYDVYLDFSKGIKITGGIQKEIFCII